MIQPPIHNVCAVNQGYIQGYSANAYFQNNQQISAPVSHQAGFDDWTSGKDYQSYYGTYQRRGDSAGAGGFNWWDNDNSW